PRYDVNLIVDHTATSGAPVVTLSQASFTQLTGKVEHAPLLASPANDFMYIRAGALHHANGGFLLIDATDLFKHDASWEALKRALRSRQARIENLAELADRSHVLSIQPEPLPLNLKVILFGDESIYHRLCQSDPEFAGLFKVQADFSPTAPRDDVHCTELLAMAGAIARQNGLRHLDRTGAARLIDEAARKTGDAEKISVRTGHLADLLREADHFAARAGHALIADSDLALALAAKDDRLSRAKAIDYELIHRGIVFIDTDGERSGQVNGLTILNAGGHAFGLPARITAQAHPGHGSVTDIERISAYGGPSHTKGVQILSGYLNGTYSNGRPLSVSASVAFEQFHGRIDGDSASAAELIAILSAIADIPLKQSIAITGSINQHGLMQPIGGANEKIEGFFDVCAARGLAPHHGVI
ncbi:MAG TPA: AAA family ATPase, partial [Steroidobacteraceae bacterium]